MIQRRLLVTGATGFVGSHLVSMLRQTHPDIEIVATSVSPGPGFVALDINDPESVTELIDRVRPEACIHLAAVTAIPVAREQPDLTWQTNLHGTLNVARGIMAVVPSSPLLFSSSAETYGASFKCGEALDETALLAPLNTYAATKAAADLALGALSSEGLHVVRLRAFNHTGAGQSEDFVVAAFARQVARIEAGLQQPVIQVGSLEPERDFLDVRDVCAAYIACLSRIETLPAGVILNIASGTPRRIGNILSDLLALSEIAVRVRSSSDLLRSVDIPLACGNAKLANSLLDWQPVIPWQQTLQDVLNDWRARVYV